MSIFAGCNPTPLRYHTWWKHPPTHPPTGAPVLVSPTCPPFLARIIGRLQPQEQPPAPRHHPVLQPVHRDRGVHGPRRGGGVQPGQRGAAQVRGGGRQVFRPPEAVRGEGCSGVGGGGGRGVMVVVVVLVMSQTTPELSSCVRRFRRDQRGSFLPVIVLESPLK